MCLYGIAFFNIVLYNLYMHNLLFSAIIPELDTRIKRYTFVDNLLSLPGDKIEQLEMKELIKNEKIYASLLFFCISII